ncbi:MAG TPA: HEAT repeat domain-containing protein [Chloroflexota bacterium]|nr:HEAT repeat domain-containing protein [Chloroflexota bacterium]HUM70074.1 HEAT repeat domain-containing protein [Chloroflexota bacterium]
MNPEEKQQLLNWIDECFDKAEFNLDICIPLGINHEHLSWNNKRELILEVWQYMERRGKTNQLVELLEGRRPERTDFPLSKRIQSPKDKEQEGKLREALTDLSFLTTPSAWEKIHDLIDEVNLAENNQDWRKAASLNAQLAELYEQEKRYVQSRDYARKAANCFLKINEKEAAIEQHLFAAEIWMNHTSFASTMADHDLEEAQKISAEVKNFALLARTYLLQAQYSMLLGFRRETERMWQQVESTLPKVHTDFQIDIATELAIQKAMNARLDGKWELATRLLEEANSRDWPLKFSEKRLELFWCLLFLHSELGNWEEVDRIYEQANNLIYKQDEHQKARWLMHYAASLARRGEADRAFEMYMSALTYFKRTDASPREKHHFFQDMIYSLINTRHDVFSSAMRYDTERLDLALTALHEDVGYLHKERARAEYVEGKIERAFAHAQYSLLYSWRKGDWSGLSEAYHILAFLYGAEQDYISATIAAISAGQKKTVEQYAVQLNNLSDADEIKQVMDYLLQTWRTSTSQEIALVALAKCIEIVPSNYLEGVVQLTTDLIRRYLVTPSNKNDNVCKSAIKVLDLLSPRFNEIQTNEIIVLCTDFVNKEILWTNQLELIKLIGACFANDCTPQTDLYLLAVQSILPYFDRGALLAEAEFSLLKIGIHAPTDVRKAIIDLFYSRSNWDFLAILKEPIPDETVRRHIEHIFRTLEPTKSSVRIGGRSIRSINNLNEYISPSMTDMVIDGFIRLIQHPDNILYRKAETILTIRWLPEEVLVKRANEIGECLLQIASNRRSDKEAGGFERLMGNEEEVRRSSLYTLGHLYAFVNINLKRKIRQLIVLLGADNFPGIRMGAAMALRLFKDPPSFSLELTFTLVELLCDEDSDVRHWAASAAGQRMADGSISKNGFPFILERLIQVATTDRSAHARAGAAYGLKILARSDVVSPPMRKKIERARHVTLNDVNFEVISMATK